MQVRDWIYVEDHCRALLEVLERGRVSETYNIGGRSEMTNLELVKQVLRELGKPESLISFVKDRPGHDRRYAMDTAKIERELGWKSAHSFAGALPKTVNWYINNTEWVKSVTSGEYLAYYQRQYGDR
jgi:dTDP-glucose 4,6-dehydratase